MIKASKAQVAFEYIVIVGLVMLFLIPLISYISSVQSRASTQLSISYAQNAANKLASQADLVYSQGPPAKVTTSIYIPPGIESSSISSSVNGSTIIFRVRVPNSLTDVAASSNANIIGTLPQTEGNYQIAVEAVASHVAITVL